MATIRKHHNKWQVQIRRKGLSPISKSFHQRKDAELWARQTETQIDLGEVQSPARYEHGKTIKDLMDAYLAKVTPTKLSANTEVYVINQFNRHKLAQKRLSEVTEADFIRYREQRLKEVMPATVVREMSIIQHAFKVSEKELGIPIKKNPLQDFKKPKVMNERQRRLKPEEYTKIVETISPFSNPCVREIVDFAIETGMRRGEILSIRKQHIEFDSKTLLIPVTKTGYPRTIPLSSKAFAILRKAVDEAETDLVFPMTPNAFRLAWERTIRRTKIQDLHFHDLRHEAVSRLFERGLSVPEVALISGHRNYKMLMRYTHIKPENLVDKLG